MTVRTAVLVLTLLLALPLISAHAAKPPDGWNHTHYFEFSELNLPTVTPDLAFTFPECVWQGTKYVLNVSPADGDFSPTNCEGVSYVWAPTCKAGLQTVVFKKRVWLPGKPIEFQASLASLNDKPLTFMEIRVNDVTVLHTKVSEHKRGLKTKASAFEFGWNDILVRARKNAPGACNQFVAEYGVYAHLHAKFAADMRIKPPEPTKLTAKIPLVVSNTGPSTALGVGIRFSVYTPNLVRRPIGGQTAAILIAGPGIDAVIKCSYTTAAFTFHHENYSGYQTICPIALDLKPGETIQLFVTFAYKNLSSTYFEKFPIAWSTSGGEVSDQRQGNNQGYRFAYACKPAHPPECKQPS